MPTYKWRRLPTKHFGEVSVPFAHIELQRSDGCFQRFALQIDSGAVVSLLRRSVADLLGVRLDAGKRIEVTSVGGGATVAYVHELKTRFADTVVYNVPFGIADTESVPNLLGRLGVFDVLQVDFDATLNETRVTAPWLTPPQRKLWKFMLETSQDISSRVNRSDLPQPADRIAAQFLRRGEQLVAAAAGLMKLRRAWEGPLIIRALFELALQFEYLMQDPAARAQQYLDFTWVTKRRRSKAVAENPSGPISRFIASSPDRATGEARNEAEYQRVRNRFVVVKGKRNRVADNWYCMPVSKLAEVVGWDGEYRLWYALGSAWSHGEPLATEAKSMFPGHENKAVFVLCLHYYARMLLRVADNVILTPEQHGFLQQFARDLS